MVTIFGHLVKSLIIFFIIFSSKCLISQAEYDYGEEESSDLLVNLFEMEYVFLSPINRYQEHLDKNLHGFAFAFFRQRKFEKPQFWGFKGSYYVLDRQSGDFVDNFGFDIFRNVTSNKASFDLAYRVYPEGDYWKFDPFFTLFLGSNFHYTTISDTDLETDENINYSFDMFGASFSYGLEIGTHLQFSEKWFANLKFSYNGGSVAKYDVLSNRSSSDPIQNFDIKSSSVESINISIGLTFAF